MRYTVALTLAQGADIGQAVCSVRDGLLCSIARALHHVERAQRGEPTQLCEPTSRANAKLVHDRLVTARDNMSILDPDQRERPKGIYFGLVSVRAEANREQESLFDELAGCPLAG